VNCHRILHQLKIAVAILLAGFSMCRKRIVDVNRQSKLFEEDLVIINGRTDEAGRLVCAIVERVQRVDRNDQSLLFRFLACAEMNLLDLRVGRYFSFGCHEVLSETDDFLWL
jgi:hypothetical protein